MRVAIIGSRTICSIELESYIPQGTTEIVSGGAKGIDTLAREYAIANRIPLTEFLPEYPKYGRAAPLRRNNRIVEYADIVIVIWDGHSRGTAHVINRCRQCGVECRVHIIKQ